MNEEKQNMAIAEACGLKYHKPTEQELSSGSYYQYQPRFTQDLNAMQSVLVDHICGDKELEERFLKELNAVIDGYADSEDVPVICEWSMAILCAPSWALAKAFLRAVGRWED